MAPLATIQITNVVNGATYFTPYIDNQTGGSILVGVAQGSAVNCLGTQSGKGGASWGYYLLTSATDVRYYKPGSNCTGSYRVWANATLQGNLFGGTGLILLTADIAP